MSQDIGNLEQVQQFWLQYILISIQCLFISQNQQQLTMVIIFLSLSCKRITKIHLFYCNSSMKIQNQSITAYLMIAKSAILNRSKSRQTNFIISRFQSQTKTFYLTSQQNNKMKIKRISLTTHQQVQQHCANNSPAKVSFRFSKSKRFKENNPECPIAFYTFTSQLSKRKSSIGSGKKFDFTIDKAQAPDSSQYNPNNYHQFTKQKGLSFGNSRQRSPDQSYLIPQIHCHPGIGAYDVVDLQKHSSSFTVRPKTVDVIEKHLSYKKNPGPGSYNDIELNTNKNQIKVSKYKGAKLGVGLTSPRFSKIKTAPGPQNYNQLDSLTPTAKYVVSTHCGTGTRPFTQEKRFKHDYWKKTENPGPGQYQKPSDFGIYGNSHFYKGCSTII